MERVAAWRTSPASAWPRCSDRGCGTSRRTCRAGSRMARPNRIGTRAMSRSASGSAAGRRGAAFEVTTHRPGTAPRATAGQHHGSSRRWSSPSDGRLSGRTGRRRFSRSRRAFSEERREASRWPPAGQVNVAAAPRVLDLRARLPTDNDPEQDTNGERAQNREFERRGADGRGYHLGSSPCSRR